MANAQQQTMIAENSKASIQMPIQQEPTNPTKQGNSSMLELGSVAQIVAALESIASSNTEVFTLLSQMAQQSIVFQGQATQNASHDLRKKTELDAIGTLLGGAISAVGMFADIGTSYSSTSGKDVTELNDKMGALDQEKEGLDAFSKELKNPDPLDRTLGTTNPPTNDEINNRIDEYKRGEFTTTRVGPYKNIDPSTLSGADKTQYDNYKNELDTAAISALQGPGASNASDLKDVQSSLKDKTSENIKESGTTQEKLTSKNNQSRLKWDMGNKGATALVQGLGQSGVQAASGKYAASEQIQQFVSSQNSQVVNTEQSAQQSLYQAGESAQNAIVQAAASQA